MYVLLLHSTTRPLPDGKKDIAPSANFFVYSGHDSTVVPLLCALGIYNGKLYQLVIHSYILLYCCEIFPANFPLYFCLCSSYLPLNFPLFTNCDCLCGIFLCCIFVYFLYFPPIFCRRVAAVRDLRGHRDRGIHRGQLLGR